MRPVGGMTARPCDRGTLPFFGHFDEDRAALRASGAVGPAEPLGAALHGIPDLMERLAVMSADGGASRLSRLWAH